MEYICFACGRAAPAELVLKRIRCPFCGAKILFKKRPEIVKAVKAR